MTAPAPQTPPRMPLMAGLLVLASLVSSCGALAGPSEAEAVTTLLTSAQATQSSLTSGVAAASSSGQVMSAEVRALLDSTSLSLEAFEEAMSDYSGDPLIGQEAEGYAQSVSLVLDLLDEGNLEVASEVTATQVAPKFATVSSVLRARQAELGGPPSSGRLVPIAVVAVVIAAAAAFVLARIRGGDEEPEHAPTPRRPDEASPYPTSSFADDPISKLESTLPPIGSTPAQAAPAEPTGTVRNPEAAHSVRGGLRTVELEGIIDAALATVTNTGWEVAIQCPPVRVLVDPLRMRRLLSNLLLSATAHGAEHIGLVAEIVDDKVEVNVGHDGELLAREHDEDQLAVPREVEHQLTVAKQLLHGMHADVRWTRWRGVSLYTVELVRGPEELPHDGGAMAKAKS